MGVLRKMSKVKLQATMGFRVISSAVITSQPLEKMEQEKKEFEQNLLYVYPHFYDAGGEIGVSLLKEEK